MTDIGGACAYLSASGTHSATKDVHYLAGKDGVIIGIVPGGSTGSSTCPTRPVQGAPTTATVCSVAGPEVFAVFKAASGAAVEIDVFSSATLTDAQVDGLIAAAYGASNPDLRGSLRAAGIVGPPSAEVPSDGSRDADRGAALARIHR